MNDPVWGWLPPAVDPWAGAVEWQLEPFDWFLAAYH